MPHRIRELEIPREDLPAIAGLSLQDAGSRGNPIPMTLTEQVMEVLERAW